MKRKEKKKMTDLYQFMDTDSILPSLENNSR